MRQGKRNKQRKVPLNATLRQILTEYGQALPPGQTNLFVSERAEHGITSRGMEYVVAGIAHAARLERVTPHVLRHTFCKNLLDQGVPLDQVATLAGHASLDVIRRYTTPSQQDLLIAVERVAWQWPATVLDTPARNEEPRTWLARCEALFFSLGLAVTWLATTVEYGMPANSPCRPSPSVRCRWCNWYGLAAPRTAPRL